MLRDTQGVTSSHVVLPIELVPIVELFNGQLTCEQIAREASRAVGEVVPVELVVKLARELEEALFVDGQPYRRERARIEHEFASADVREASHAGGAYHDDPNELAEYIDAKCLGIPARREGKGMNGRAKAHANGSGRLVGLVAPHIDPWRGARCYGAAYNALAAALPADADTFILLGTSHAPMREPFALCRKAFATPLGPMEADLESIDALAAASDFDTYADQFNHKREHSLEFQAVFLRHLLGKKKARIVPILAGLGEQQVSGRSPKGSAAIGRFYDALRRIIDKRRAVVIAGADLAHVGPRFGDARPLDGAERSGLDAVDHDSLAHAERVDAEGFWKHVASDLEQRRVCGLAPIYSLLRTIDPSAKGRIHHYEQTVDPEEGSIVSHAAMSFHA